jgi:hypothetical protein
MLEARDRIEAYIKARVPRAYRFDWRDLKARISYHRDAETELRKVIGELGGEIVSVREARPPLRIMEADFSKARVPPAPISEELERMILWSKFSAIMTALGGKPEDHVEDFEATLEALKGRPFEEKQRRIEELARTFAPPALPPVIIPEEIRKAVREEVRKAISEAIPVPAVPAPAVPPMPWKLVPGLLRTGIIPPPIPPEVTIRTCVFPHPEEHRFHEPTCGEMFVGPTDATIFYLERMLPFPGVYYIWCPKHKKEYFGYPDLDVMIESTIEHRMVDPIVWPWLEELMKKLREMKGV